MSLSDQIARTDSVMLWLDDALADTEFKATGEPKFDDRIRVSAACFHQVIEHVFAIQRLFSNPPFYGSAFALIRPVFEGLVRGLWLLHCATPAQATRFIEKDQIKFGIDELIRRIEAEHTGFAGGNLSELKEGAWDAMCSYAHTGALQLQRRIGESEIRPDYGEKECEEVLIAARIFALFAGFEIAAVGNKSKVCDEILRLLKEEVGVRTASTTP